MIRSHASILIALLFSTHVFAWTANNPSTGPFLVPGGELRMFFDYGRVSLFAEGQMRAEPFSTTYKTYMVGFYAQPWDHLRIGAFFGQQWGQHHDSDWNWSDTANAWVWDNVNNRSENILTLDVSPRTTLDFLPGENWLGEFKMRYSYNYFAREQTLTMRPGLTYFWLSEGSPLWTFFLQYEAYIPLNYAAGLVYKHWVYLSALKPIMKGVQLGVTAAYHLQNWVNTPFFTSTTTPASTFFVSEGSFNIGLVSVIHFDILN